MRLPLALFVLTTSLAPGFATAATIEFGDLRWRALGPNRGGRSQAAAGSVKRPLEYYFGATGGGLWKTGNGGVTWAPVTDGQIRSSSVGAVAVAESNPDIVYVGMGETEFRGNVMQGDGVYKSTDGGKTWKHSGLADSQAIARIRIDPANPDIVFAAVFGHPLRCQPGARGVQIDRWRRDVEACPLPQRSFRRGGFDDGSTQPGVLVRFHVGCVSYAVAAVVRRAGVGAV